MRPIEYARWRELLAIACVVGIRANSSHVHDPELTLVEDRTAKSTDYGLPDAGRYRSLHPEEMADHAGDEDEEEEPADRATNQCCDVARSPTLPASPQPVPDCHGCREEDRHRHRGEPTNQAHPIGDGAGGIVSKRLGDQRPDDLDGTKPDWNQCHCHPGDPQIALPGSEPWLPRRGSTSPLVGRLIIGLLDSHSDPYRLRSVSSRGIGPPSVSRIRDKRYSAAGSTERIVDPMVET